MTANTPKPARLLDCGFCFEEHGEEVHPHPECPIGQVVAPADQTALRDRIAAALYERERPRRDPAWADAYAMDRETFEAMADAVLAVLLEQADRAAVLREAAAVADGFGQPRVADFLRGMAEQPELRRVAAGEQPAETLTGYLEEVTAAARTVVTTEKTEALLRQITETQATDRAAIIAELLPVWEAVYEPGNVSDYLIGYANDQDAATGMAEAWMRSQAEVAGRLEWTPWGTATAMPDGYDAWFELVERHDDGIDTGPGIIVRRRIEPAVGEQPETQETP